MPSNSYQNRHASSSRGNTYVQNNPLLANNTQPRVDGSLPPPPATLERPRDCINRHSTPPFALICRLMEKLRDEEAAKRRETLERFFELWRQKVGPDLYPLIRLLLPERDRERAVYGLKEMTLAKCYVSVLGLDPKSPAAQRLVHWKQPVHVPGQTADATSGDFAKVCYQAIKARSTVNQGQLTVEAVNSLLDDLANRRHGKLADYLPTFSKIYSKTTPSEQEWLIRIILKDLRISVREKGVLAAFHPNASELFNVCSDLKRVCWTLHNPNTRLGETQTSITLFNAFLPMLCHRQASASLDVIAKVVGAGKEFVIEEKLDGERMQVHMRNNGQEWFYCSRKAKDYGYLYGTHVGEGTLTPHIAGAFNKDVRNCILDGEMLVWDPLMEKYLAFGGLKTAALDKSNDEDAPRPCFKVFDILYLNDTCLMSKRLSERKKLLYECRVFDMVKGRLELPFEGRGKTGKDIQQALEKILEEKGEGLVVKNVDSFYETNARVSAWTKVKPEYADEMGENLDVLVLGGWYGSGGRGGKISSLLCGVRVQDEDDGLTERPTFQTVCKVGSGMNIEDYQWIQKKHGHHFHKFDRRNPPDWMIVGPSGLDDKPDVYINPEDSFVIEVKASEIVPAALNYGCGYTLRFPRCKYIRWDAASRDPRAPIDENYKQWDMWNSLSLAEFTEMLRKEKKYSNEGNGHARKKKKVTSRSKVVVQPSRKGQVISSKATDHLFSGKTFYILKDCPEHTKPELEKLVHQYGGDFTQAQLADGSAIIIAPDAKGPRTQALIRKGNDVIKATWIQACIDQGAVLPYYKEFVVHPSEETKKSKVYEKIMEDYDPGALVRDRTGDKRKRTISHSPSPDGQDLDEDVKPSVSPSVDEPTAPPTAAQSQMEDAWGLRREKANAKATPDSSDTEGAGAATDSDPESDVDLKEEDEDVVEDDGETAIPAGADDSSQEEAKRMDMPKMQLGDASGANDYDGDKIFSHLCFYIDSAENADKNGLQKTYPSQRVVERLAKAQASLEANGGQVTTSIDTPELTHIVMDDVDSGRYSELVTKTSQPKYKHIVVTDWVGDSLENGTLQTEDLYKPA